MSEKRDAKKVKPDVSLRISPDTLEKAKVRNKGIGIPTFVNEDGNVQVAEGQDIGLL